MQHRTDYQYIVMPMKGSVQLCTFGSLHNFRDSATLVFLHEHAAGRALPRTELVQRNFTSPFCGRQLHKLRCAGHERLTCVALSNRPLKQSHEFSKHMHIIAAVCMVHADARVAARTAQVPKCECLSRRVKSGCWRTSLKNQHGVEDLKSHDHSQQHCRPLRWGHWWLPTRTPTDYRVTRQIKRRTNFNASGTDSVQIYIFLQVSAPKGIRSTELTHTIILSSVWCVIHSTTV